MNSYIFINSKTQENLLKKYKLRKRGKQKIIKSVQKRSITYYRLNRLVRKIYIKDSITSLFKQL